MRRRNALAWTQVLLLLASALLVREVLAIDDDGRESMERTLRNLAAGDFSGTPNDPALVPELLPRLAELAKSDCEKVRRVVYGYYLGCVIRWPDDNYGEQLVDRVVRAIDTDPSRLVRRVTLVMLRVEERFFSPEAKSILVRKLTEWQPESLTASGGGRREYNALIKLCGKLELREAIPQLQALAEQLDRRIVQLDEEYQDRLAKHAERERTLTEAEYDRLIRIPEHETRRLLKGKADTRPWYAEFPRDIHLHLANWGHPGSRRLLGLPDERRPVKRQRFSFEHSGWYARLALARMGDRESSEFCVYQMTYRNRHWVAREGLPFLAYTQTAEARQFIIDYVFWDEPLTELQREKHSPGGQHAVRLLQHVIPDFPLKFKEFQGASKDQTEEARRWLLEHGYRPRPLPEPEPDPQAPAEPKLEPRPGR